MNVLDENVPDHQRLLLRRIRIPIRQVGRDLSKKGIGDEQIIPLLLRLHRPTFFTLDNDFYDNDLCHERYCLVFLDVIQKLFAEYIRRFLRHPELNTRAKRLGRVLRVSPGGVAYFADRNIREQHLSWP
jgi:hypothetical protein